MIFLRLLLVRRPWAARAVQVALLAGVARGRRTVPASIDQTLKFLRDRSFDHPTPA